MKTKTILISLGLLVLLFVLGFFVKMDLTGNAVQSESYFWCVDSDGGINYYQKGSTSGINPDGTSFHGTESCTISFGGFEWWPTESCKGEMCEIVEFSCNGSLQGNPISYNCPEGCSNGACINSSRNEILISGKQTNFSWDCGNNPYYASDVLREIERQYSLEGENLLNQTDYKDLPIIIKDVLISGYDGSNITGRMRETANNGCNVYETDTNPCISPIIEIGRIKFYSLFELKPWANPRTLVDGSSATPLPKDFFRNMGELTRWILEHEFTHTIYYHRFENETIGQYEDRVSSVATTNLLNYRVNCTQIKYFDKTLNKEIAYPYEDFIIGPDIEYEIICDSSTRQNIESFSFMPSCSTIKVINGSLPNAPQEPPNNSNLTTINQTGFDVNYNNSNFSSRDYSTDEEKTHENNTRGNGANNLINNSSQNKTSQKEISEEQNFIRKLINWFRRIFA